MMTTPPNVTADPLVLEVTGEQGDGAFQWHESLAELRQAWQGDAQVNYYDLNSINAVEEGQAIGTLGCAAPGTVGADMVGDTDAPKEDPMAVELDSTVRISDGDTNDVIANRSGRAVYRDHRISIAEVLKIDGDVDSKCGDIDSSVDVHVAGTVCEGLSLASCGTVSVNGVIEAATVKATGHVVVRGGIIQRTKGLVQADGDIVAKFCDKARLRAGGFVKVAKDVLNCQIHCMEKLLAEQGQIIDGSIYAREGIEVATLGNETGVRTDITVGMDPEVLSAVDQFRETVKVKRAAINRIRESVRPLLANQKQLAAAQKERATELMFQADETEEELAKAEKKHADRLAHAQPRGTPYVSVSHTVHRGVQIRIGRQMTTFNKEVAGPVRFEPRTIKNAQEIVAVDVESGSVRRLPNTQVAEPTPAKE